MPSIRPVTDLADRLDEVTADVIEGGRAVFLTNEGRGEMVLLSYDAYESLLYDVEVYVKLLEAEQHASATSVRLTPEEVLSSALDTIVERSAEAACA